MKLLVAAVSEICLGRSIEVAIAGVRGADKIVEILFDAFVS